MPFAARFAARDVLRGREVQLSDGTEGRCEGVGWGGELLVRTASGMKTITSAEVSVRPVRARRMILRRTGRPALLVANLGYFAWTRGGARRVRHRARALQRDASRSG